MNAYYNEIDPYAAQWLRNLIARGLIAPGDVDERSILEVKPDDLRSYTQCHFFAGIGGWSHAMRLAGWPDDRPVWTGSCPCQPFSVAGTQRGSADERHLWPAFFDLISQCRPCSVFGEQVAGASGLAWLDHVCADMESAGYAAAAADLCAAGAGAPHIRQRLYWVAHADNKQCTQLPYRSREGQKSRFTNSSTDGCMVNTMRDGRERSCHISIWEQTGKHQSGHQSNGVGFWEKSEWLTGIDNRSRPVEPGTFPLAYGIPGRVGRLRAYGNAIVPQVAAVFVMANAGDKRGA